jgi:outer membrane protein assembly factor BamD
MTQSRAFRSALLPLLAVALAITGCASTKAKKDRPYVARDVDTLYTAAQSTLAKRQYKLAAAQFDEVERQHPYSVWARRAQLMSAYSYYVSQDYSEAILSAQRFLSLHPGSREAPYAYYVVAVSYYEQISAVDRDQKTTLKALDALRELIRRYPTSEYAADARLKVYYQANKQFLGAVDRFRTVIDSYNTTSHTPEALERLVECYLALGLPEEAKKAAAVLGYNYPGSKWYKHSYALIGKKVA